MPASSDRRAQATALLIAALAVALTIRFNSFVPWAADSGAYISAAHRWAEADVFAPASFIFWAPWSSAGRAEWPLGHRGGPEKGTITSVYPLGYPVLLAGALKVGGELAPHLVSPVLLGVLTWCAFILGSRLSTPWAGVMSALLISATPVTLGHAIVPFSDVPAAAFWAVAWVMSARPGLGAAAAAGSATAFAVMIRPNLAPLAVVVAAAVLFSHRAGAVPAFKRVLVFGLTALIGPLVVLWSQAVLYGHPLQAGYEGSLDDFFSVERIPTNALLYPRLLVELHSWLIVGAVVMVPLAWRQAGQDAARYQAAVIAVTAAGLIAVNYALYLAYLTYDGWYWLRFLLPALLAVFVLFTGAVDHLRLWLIRRHPWAGAIAVIPTLAVGLAPHREIRPPGGYPRLQLMGHYLREVLPANAVIMTFTHGGALATYTGQPILRLDSVPAAALDDIITDLHRHGQRPVFVLDLGFEGEFFRDRFTTSTYGRLDWPARAEFASGLSVTYHDPLDRDLFMNGDRWATDVVVYPPGAATLPRWSTMRAPLERIIFPPPQETWMFKQALEATYRDSLGRPATLTAGDPQVVHKWMRRYLRYRTHECGHDEAASRIFRQLAGEEARPLCARPADLHFPPHDETVSFRRQLEARLRDLTPTRKAVTFVDSVGDAVWLQEYLQARLQNCSHAEATAAVLGTVRGRSAPAPCASR